MVQEEADELQLQEEMEIEEQLANERGARESVDEEESDSESVMTPAEIREHRAMERRRSKAHHRATLSSNSRRKSMFEQRGTTMRHNSIQDQKKMEFLRKRKSSTAVTPG